MKRICVIGACCTRDAFNKNFVSNWRDFFLLEVYYFQPSIISLVSEPVPFCRKDISHPNGKHDRWEDMLINELNKDYLDNLISLAPDAIVIDFYSDVVNGVIPINGYSYITNRTQDWKENVVFHQLQKGRELKSYVDFYSYFQLWKESYDKFIMIIKKYLPDTMVIVNSCRCNSHYEKDGKVYKYDVSKKYDIDKLNEIWSRFDEYSKGYGAKIISYEKNYLLNYNYIYGGLWIVHYKNEFYRDFIEKLKNIIKEADVLKRYVSNNLIINGDFQHKSLFYRHWDKTFQIIGDRVVVKNDAEEKIPQIWSNLICNGNEKQRYIYSFYCLIKSPDCLRGNKMVAAIRAYEKTGLLFASDCKQELIICLNDAQIKSGKWEKISVAFVIDAPYFSCGLAVGKDSNVEYRKMSCYLDDDGDVSRFDNSIVERELLDNYNMLIDVNETYITSMKQLSRISQN